MTHDAGARGRRMRLHDRTADYYHRWRDFDDRGTDICG